MITNLYLLRGAALALLGRRFLQLDGCLVELRPPNLVLRAAVAAVLRLARRPGEVRARGPGAARGALSRHAAPGGRGASPGRGRPALRRRAPRHPGRLLQRREARVGLTRVRDPVHARVRCSVCVVGDIRVGRDTPGTIAVCAWVHLVHFVIAQHRAFRGGHVGVAVSGGLPGNVGRPWIRVDGGSPRGALLLL